MSCRTDREMPLYSSWIELIVKCRLELEKWITTKEYVTTVAKDSNVK